MFHNDNERDYFLRTGYSTLTQDQQENRFQFPPVLLDNFCRLRDEFPNARAHEIHAHLHQEQARQEKCHQEMSMLQTVVEFQSHLHQRLAALRQRLLWPGHQGESTAVDPLEQIVVLLNRNRLLQRYTPPDPNDPNPGVLAERAEIFKIAKLSWHDALVTYTRACERMNRVRGAVDSIGCQMEAVLRSMLWEQNPDSMYHHLARYGFPNRLHAPLRICPERV